jgi:membrane fusion protein, heavy metal efflux system
MSKCFFVAIVMITIVSCNDKQPEKERADYSVSHDTVIVNTGSTIPGKLQKLIISPKSYVYELTTSGTVQAIPNNFALIAAPFAGRITRSYVRLGQYVKAFDPVFEISSPEYFETGKVYYQSKEEMDLAYKNMSRQKDLLNKGVGVQKDFEESQVNFELKKKDFENSIASLRVFQVDTAELVLGQPLIVRSPINGSVVENNIVIGQYIKEDSEPVATVAELSKIWVAGQVKEKDIRYISEHSEVEIRPIAFPDKVIKGKIYHIKSIIDEETRSVQVLVECDNKDRIMKPGMFVSAIFRHSIDSALVIPSKAIFQHDDASFVFLHLGGSRYLKRRIEILTGDKDSVIVKTGLSSGDEIISYGGFYLLEER